MSRICIYAFTVSYLRIYFKDAGGNFASTRKKLSESPHKTEPVTVVALQRYMSGFSAQKSDKNRCLGFSRVTGFLFGELDYF